MNKHRIKTDFLFPPHQDGLSYHSGGDSESHNSLGSTLMFRQLPGGWLSVFQEILPLAMDELGNAQTDY